VLQALQAALEVEHQVVYGYGLAGAHLTGRLRDRSRARVDVHAALRDRLAELVSSAGGRPVVAQPAYGDPVGVTGRATALALLVRLEDALTGAAWDLVAASAAGGEVRRLGIDTLADAATWAARWRDAAGDVGQPALPGRPQPA
jgi:hypothetical protein